MHLRLIHYPDTSRRYVAKTNSRKGRRDRFEREEIAFHQRVRSGYLEMAKKEPERWLVIDGSLPKKDIQRFIWERIEPLLKLR